MIEIRRALPEDAEQMLKNLKIIGKETDNLTFGEEGLPFTVEQEQEYIKSLEGTRSVFFVALVDGKIVGDASFTAESRERMAHRGEFGVSILKEYWGRGIGGMLLEKIIDFARNEAKAEIISLEVRSDNTRAIKLYEKYGFIKTGTFPKAFKVRGEYADIDTMVLFV